MTSSGPATGSGPVDYRVTLRARLTVQVPVAYAARTIGVVEWADRVACVIVEANDWLMWLNWDPPAPGPAREGRTVRAPMRCTVLWDCDELATPDEDGKTAAVGAALGWARAERWVLPPGVLLGVWTLARVEARADQTYAGRTPG